MTMRAGKNPILRLAFMHTAIIFVVLHLLGGTVYFHVLPFTEHGIAVSHAERLIHELGSDLEVGTPAEIAELVEGKPNVKIRIEGDGYTLHTNDPLFFKRSGLPLLPEGPFRHVGEEGTFHGHNGRVTQGPLIGAVVQIVRDEVFIANAVHAAIIRYEFLVVLVCLILFYVFLTTLNIQLKEEDIDDDQIREELNAASLINTGIHVFLVGLMAYSYYGEGLMYAFFHQLGPLLDAHLEDFHPLVSAMITIALVTVEVVTGSIPAAVLYPGAGILFGAQLGAVYVLIGTVIGSAIGYVQGHAISLTFHESETQAAEFSEYIKKQGWLGVFVLRVNPITSFSFINQVCGVLRVPFGGFLVATTLARTPMVLLASFMGQYIFRHVQGAVSIISGTIVIYLIYLVVRTSMDAGRLQKKYLQLYVTNINQMGAATQSSDFLAKKMVEPLRQLGEDSVILELGPGTGVFTEKILEIKPAGTRLITLESNEKLAQQMKIDYPEAENIHGDARCIRDHLRELGVEEVDSIVSGLPFLSFPQALTEEILEQVTRSLKPGGVFVLFQYTLILLPLIRRWFNVDKVGWTPFNVPPAFVLTCKQLEAVQESRSGMTSAIAGTASGAVERAEVISSGEDRTCT